MANIRQGREDPISQVASSEAPQEGDVHGIAGFSYFCTFFWLFQHV